MDAKQKTEELVNKFSSISDALKCVDEILRIYKENWNIENSYWRDVKLEIEKL
jgi:hypothetical protein